MPPFATTPVSDQAETGDLIVREDPTTGMPHSPLVGNLPMSLKIPGEA